METKTKELKNVTDHFKGQTFTVASEIGQGQINHRATVIKSYDFTCLVKVQKSSTTSDFHEMAIYKIGYDRDNEEQLIPVMINYEENDYLPPRYSAPDDIVTQKFDELVTAMKLKFFESDVIANRKDREAVSKERSEQVRLSNITFIRERQAQIHNELTEKCSGIPVRKLVSDKMILGLINENSVLEGLKHYSTRKN